MRLSQHFTLAELTRSQTAAARGIDNSAPPQVVENLKLVAQRLLEPMRIHFGIPFSPTSGFRSEALERAITWDRGFRSWCLRRGLPHNETSWVQYFGLKSHPRGEAVDVKIPGIPTPVLFEWCKRNIPEFDQLIMENYDPREEYSGWVHISIRSSGNRRQIMELQE